MLLTPTPPHGSRTNIGVIEPGDQGTDIKTCLDIKSRVISNSAYVSELTIKLLSERVGSIQQDVGFRVNSLQLFQRGLPPTDTLRTNTHRCNSRMPFTTLFDAHRGTFSSPTHLTLRSESGLLQPRPNALDPARMLRVAVGVPTHALVLLH